jgi:uncharacterized membrane protein YedE/YeeE
MAEEVVRKSPLPWWLAGVLLGLVQVLAVGLHKPLGVSTQFVVADAKAISAVAPEYAQNHELINAEKYQNIGYGWWLDAGILVGAGLAALACRRWKLRKTTVWWSRNQGASVSLRMLCCFIGGFLILFGSRLAHGCTSGQFASGWAQLSVSAIPFTITLFGFGMLTARLVHPKSPAIGT